MAILRYIFPITLLMLLTGCYETFEPKIDTKPVICINSLITAGEPIEVEVTHTWAFNNEYEGNNHNVDDAVISIYVNGTLQHEDYIPKEGDDIRIVAESGKYGSAEASVTVPEAVPISAIEFTPDILSIRKNEEQPMDAYISFNMKIAMKIADTHISDDFFRLDYNCWSPAGDEGNGDEYNASHPTYAYFSPGTLDYDAEPIFKEHISVFESVMGGEDEIMTIFSDRQFAGKEYTLNLRFKNASYSVTAPEYDSGLYDCSMVFTLATVSRSYYDRALYVWQRDTGVIGDLGDLGFAEPIWGYSNVSSGAGVVAARSFSTSTLSLKEFIHDALQ